MPKIVVQSTSTPYATKITARNHEWLADEPVDSEGQDRAATPFEQFLGSIGSCSVITAQMYARRKGWPLVSIEMEIDHQRIEAADCPDCETEKGKISEISLLFRIEGDLTEEQRERLLEIAGRCPVKRTIAGEVKFRVSSR